MKITPQTTRESSTTPRRKLHRLEIGSQKQKDDQDCEKQPHSRLDKVCFIGPICPLHGDLHAARWNFPVLDCFINCFDTRLGPGRTRSR